MAAQVGPHPPKGRAQSMQVEAIDDEALMSYARLPSWITPSSTSMVGSMVLLVGYLLALTVLEVMAIAGFASSRRSTQDLSASLSPMALALPTLTCAFIPRMSS